MNNIKSPDTIVEFIKAALPDDTTVQVSLADSRTLTLHAPLVDTTISFDVSCYTYPIDLGSILNPLSHYINKAALLNLLSANVEVEPSQTIEEFLQIKEFENATGFTNKDVQIFVSPHVFSDPPMLPNGKNFYTLMAADTGQQIVYRTLPDVPDDMKIEDRECKCCGFIHPIEITEIFYKMVDSNIIYGGYTCPYTALYTDMPSPNFMVLPPKYTHTRELPRNANFSG